MEPTEDLMNVIETKPDVTWIEALREELAIVRAKANQPCPDGVNQETWDGIIAPYKREILTLRTALSVFD